MEQKRNWILRPVAWIATIAMVLGLQLIAELICDLGELLVIIASRLSTIVIVILATIFGGAYLSLWFYAATMLPVLLVSLSEKIYPSHHAFRYYFVGIYEIIGCALLILAAIFGFVSGGSMFWFYARYAWLIIASITMIVTGRSVTLEQKA